MDWDVFISHASEDKDTFARPLANALKKKGISIWFDEFTIKVGDRLLGSIEYGLKKSRYGIVILSPSFFAKHWPQVELDGLAQKEINGQKVILPVWHDVTVKDIRKHSTILAGRVGVSSDAGLDHVVYELLRVIQPNQQNRANPKNRKKPQQKEMRLTSQNKPIPPQYKECPVCGKMNVPDSTFRCKNCKRPFICLQHQNAQTYLCSECEEKKKFKSVDYLRSEVLRHPYDSQKVLQLCEILYSQAQSSCSLKRWSIARQLLKEIIQLVPDFNYSRNLLNSTYTQEAAQYIKQQNFSSASSLLYEFLGSTSFEEFYSSIKSMSFKTKNVYKSDFTVMNTEKQSGITYEYLMSAMSSRGTVCTIDRLEFKLNGDYTYGLIFKTTQLGILITFPYGSQDYSGYGQVGVFIYG